MPDGVFEQGGHHHRGQGRDDEQQQDIARFPVALGRVQTEHAGGKLPPVAPEIGEQGGERAEMQQHQERQEGVGALVDVPVQQGRHDDGVAERAHREHFGGAL